MTTKIKIQRETKNISKNLKTSMSLFLLAIGSILLAFSCAPSAGVEDNSTPPGPATKLLMEDADVDSTSFVVQWSEPADTGTKSDGTALSPSEIVYRIYYLAGTAEQTEPDSESIQQNPNVLKKEVTGVTQTSIMGLLPDTRYFVTVVSYNAFSKLETESSEVFESNTRTSVVDFVGELSYAEITYPFVVGSTDTITPDSTPSIPTTDGNSPQISYELIKGEGDDVTVFVPEPTIDEAGVIAINSITNAGTSTYLVRVSAIGYSTQEVTVTIVIVASDFVNTLSYAETSYQFTVGVADTITPDGTPSIPATDGSSPQISYELVKGEGDDVTVFVPEPIIDEAGVIAINSITNAGTSPYTVRASAMGYSTQEVPLTIVINEKLQVSTYHSEATDVLPVEVGQAANDNGAYALGTDDVVVGISSRSGLIEGEYTIHFGDTADDYNRGSYQKTISDGTIKISRSELTLYSFPFTDGAAIGMSRPSLTDIYPIAIYRPSNIYKYQDLQAMRKDLDQDYILKKNIVFPSVEAGFSNYEAVGDDSGPFIGTFDGAGYSITGIQIEGSGNYQGLFGVMSASLVDTLVVQSLELRDFKIMGNTYVGALAGWIKQGTIENVNVVSSDPDLGKIEINGSGVENGNGFGGGLLGQAGTGVVFVSVKIQNTSSGVLVSGTGIGSNRIGGLIGSTEEDVMVSESHATGSVSGTGDDIGGLIGRIEGGTVSGYATGSVTGSNNIGSLAGYNGGIVSGYATGPALGTEEGVGGLVGRSSNGSASVGYATGSVSGSDLVGGLVGYNVGTATGYATGSVTGNDKVGGLVGRNYRNYVVGYATGSVTGISSVGGLVGESRGPIVGYATGVVVGQSTVGGLVGKTSDTTQGYARGVVRRSSGTSLSFGNTIGSNTGTDTTRSSKIENKIYDGEEGEIELTGVTGTSGSIIKISSTTTQTVFSGFTFGNELGKWTWVADGKWVAINIGDEVKLASDQPINACIFADSVDDCLVDSELP